MRVDYFAAMLATTLAMLHSCDGETKLATLEAFDDDTNRIAYTAHTGPYAGSIIQIEPAFYLSSSDETSFRLFRREDGSLILDNYHDQIEIESMTIYIKPVQQD
jgi:hypothetical protein